MSLISKRGVRLRLPAAALALALSISLFPFSPQPDPQQAGGAVIGSVESAFFDPGELESRFGAEFVKSACGVGREGYADLASLLSGGNIKQVILTLDFSEAGDKYTPEEPDPDKISNIDRVGDLDVYEKEYDGLFDNIQGGIKLNRTGEAAKNIRRIKALCDEKGVTLTVMLMPVHISRYNSFDPADIAKYKNALAGVCDFWDFSISSLSYEPRYFHTRDRARSGVCTMALNRITDAGYFPNDFGALVTEKNIADVIAAQSAIKAPKGTAAYARRVPVLLYHNITDDPKTPSDITPATFRRHMEAVKNAGYTAVTAKEMIDFVYNGGGLPEKPVYITIDDGYLSNYIYAYPILKELGLKATIYVIGASIGHTTYKSTSLPITPHFTVAQADEMEASGVIEIQSHTYDMHQWEEYEGSSVRDTVLQFKNETDHDYAMALKNDFNTYQAKYGRDFYALAYPKGQYVDMSEQVFRDMGVKLTVSTTRDRRNVLIRGIPQSLYALCRYDVPEGTSNETLLGYLEK